jgi:hypothetical protein
MVTADSWLTTILKVMSNSAESRINHLILGPDRNLRSTGRVGASNSDLAETSAKPVVAVGTIITDRPPHRSVRARLRIRLLPRMQSGEASHRIRMQNAGSRNPTAEERIESIPSYLSALTATHQHGAPQPADATAKDA